MIDLVAYAAYGLAMAAIFVPLLSGFRPWRRLGMAAGRAMYALWVGPIHRDQLYQAYVRRVDRHCTSMRYSWISGVYPRRTRYDWAQLSACDGTCHLLNHATRAQVHPDDEW